MFTPLGTTPLEMAWARGLATCASRAPSLAAASHTSQLRLMDLSIDRLRDILVSDGKPAFRATQIAEQLYKRVDARGKPVAPLTSFSGMLNLPASDRQAFAEAFTLASGTFDQRHISSDGTIKWLYASPSDSATVETVFIPDFRARRGTVCVSSQVGCTLACRFCRTGTQPLARNLTAGDIVGQVLLAMREVDGARERWKQQQHGLGGSPVDLSTYPPPVNRVVMMGQGEPLMNYRSVLTALDTMTHRHGLRLAPHHITLSTAGVAPLLPRLASEGPPGLRLAVSLHAPNDELRAQLMDINDRWPITDVMAAVGEYMRISLERLVSASGPRSGSNRSRGTASSSFNRTSTGSDDEEGLDSDGDDEDDDDSPLLTAASSPSQRHNSRGRARVSFEYIGLKCNTQPQHAEQLLAVVRKAGIPLSMTHVNLIPFNQWPREEGEEGSSSCNSSSGLKPQALAPLPPGLLDPAPLPQLLAFQRRLTSGGMRATMRTPRGSDILGACGQLKSEVQRGMKDANGMRAKTVPVAAE